MPAFTIQELIQFAFSMKEDALPAGVRAQLVELENSLVVPEDAPSGFTTSTYHHRGGSGDSQQEKTHKYRNRYDMKSPLHNGGEHGTSSNPSNSSAAKHTGPGVKKRGGGGGGGAHTNWDTIRSPVAPEFKATKLEPKSDADKVVSDIRIALNKLSTANYDKLQTTICDAISAYLGSPNVSVDTTARIIKTIFDVACLNKFYSELYATLYKNLLQLHPDFRTKIDEYVETLSNWESIPQYIDPDTDYDGFCVYSKACDIRKSACIFLGNCRKHDILHISQISANIAKCADYIESVLTEDGKEKIVEEIIETLYILITNCADDLKQYPAWHQSILPTIKTLAESRNKGYPSLSNRAAFKCMDIIDKVK